MLALCHGIVPGPLTELVDVFTTCSALIYINSVQNLKVSARKLIFFVSTVDKSQIPEYRNIIILFPISSFIYILRI